MPSRSITATGFHLGETVLHSVCLARSGDAVRLQEAVSVPVDAPVDPALLGGEEGRAAVAVALGDARSALPDELGAVCVGLGHGGYLLKACPLLHANPRRRGQQRDNREHMLWEAEQFLGEEQPLYSVESVALGRQGFVVAARVAVLDLYERVFSAAALPGPDFDIEPFALHNSAEAAGLLDSGGVTVLVGVNGGGADVLAAEDGVLIAARHCLRQGEDFPELCACAKQCLESARADVGDGMEAESIWVAGTDAAAICSQLQDEMSCPGEIMPWSRLIPLDAPPDNAAALAVAAGLALRGLYR